MVEREVGSVARRRGRPGYDQATVLTSAIELFNRQGYEGTSMGDLARELGLSKSALYHHFPSKESLLAQALDEALSELSAAVGAAAGVQGSESAYDRLRDVVRKSVFVLESHQPAVTLLLRVRGNSQLEQDALQRRRGIDRQLAKLVKAAADEGTLRSDIDPALVSRLLFGMVNSLVEWYQHDGEVDAILLADAIAELAFEGLVPR